ncbi:MAG: hypothetical protein LBR22_06305 [Desulfovibrio sp.]|jgi:uncharacterized protein YecT (DUF1311 family)|nr:hypothetical protein [Desulfovibrio sp.]
MTKFFVGLILLVLAFPSISYSAEETAVEKLIRITESNLKTLKDNESSCQEKTEGITVNIKDCQYEHFEGLDKLYDIVSKSCVKVLPKAEQQLMAADNESFLKIRNLAIEKATAKYEGGTLAGVVGNSIYIDLTRKRIRFLLSVISATDPDNDN